ncbi:MAG: cobyric acid synthase [Acidimicrobiia bacterium]|nr:cobyric acid synthase [Acidimicrobiia bacterium]
MAAIMVQGCTSSAGKSLVVAALARIYARRGVAVAPFKGQNMSNNARAVEGGEIGTAQWMQAKAAGITPQTRMNPVLIKPEAGGSQVIRNGIVDPVAGNLDWRERSSSLWTTVKGALHSLMSEFDLVVIEGAGSPAEPNLWDRDIANMRVAEEADAPVLLTVDIDRGGAFAHLYGTWATLPPQHQNRLAGFILNKFHGDATLLEPAPATTANMTGMRHLGTLPWIEHSLPDEDNSFYASRSFRQDVTTVAIIRWPTISNLDEFAQLSQVVNIEWAERPDQLLGADMIILPGSKHVVSDLAWFRARGFEDRLIERADAGVPILGICGGMQILGEHIVDPCGVDGSGQGIALLPLTTTFEEAKHVAQVHLQFAAVQGRWSGLSDLAFDGYDIRHGRTTLNTADQVQAILPNNAGFVKDNVLGIATHGLLENQSALSVLFGAASTESFDAVLDRVADITEEALDMDTIDKLAGSPC